MSKALTTNMALARKVERKRQRIEAARERIEAKVRKQAEIERCYEQYAPTQVFCADVMTGTLYEQRARRYNAEVLSAWSAEDAMFALECADTLARTYRPVS